MSEATFEPIEDFLPRIRGVVQIGNGKWKGLCPKHEADGDSHNPSLHITRNSNGDILVCCMVCGPEATVDIVHEVNSTMSKLFKERKRHGSGDGRRKVEEYIYLDANGVPVFRVERIEYDSKPKNFPQSKPDGNGGWIYGTNGVEKLLYGLPQLLAASPGSLIFIPEGERKVNRLHDWKYLATCNPGAAKKWTKAYCKYLKGHDVILLPDNDPPDDRGNRTGYEHVNKIRSMLIGIARSVRTLILPGLGPKGDIVNWISAGGTKERFQKLVDECMSGTASQSLSEPPLQKMDSLDLRLKESRNDIGNGKRLISKHGSDLRYCPKWKSWLVYDGKRWKNGEDSQVYRWMVEIAESLWDELRTFGKDINEKMYGEISAFIKATCQVHSIKKAIEAASWHDSVKVRPDELDRGEFLLNCTNGTVDLTNGELLPHRREDLITKLCPTSFNIHAKAPEWESALNLIFASSPEMVDFSQRLAGYGVTGSIREHVLPVLHGTGANGKSTFVESIFYTLGDDYCCAAPVGLVTENRGGNKHPCELAILFGKRMVALSESNDGDRLAEGTVKSLTGGDRISCRRINENWWDFDPTHKFLFSTNHKPRIKGVDEGIWRRIRLIPFTQKFWNPAIGESGPPELQRDDTLKDRLKEEREGILVWLITGCISWQRDGLEAPTEVREATASYRSRGDVIGRFISDRCLIADAARVKFSELYTAMSVWCAESGDHLPVKKSIGESLQDKGFVPMRSNGIWYQGLTLKEEYSADFS